MIAGTSAYLVNASKPNTPSAAAASTEPTSRAPRVVEDQVEISEQGQKVAQFDSSLLAKAPDLTANLRSFGENAAAFRDEIGNLFRAAGIDTSLPVDLRADASGTIRVTNDHPDKARIEALFADNPDLANRFRSLSATASLKRAVEAHQAFAKAYDADPEGALARFSDMFAGSKGDMYFRFEGNELAALFATPAGEVTPWWSTSDAAV